MKYADLIQLFFERSNALQWYWTIYVVIIGGLLAFSSQRQRRDLLTTTLVTVLYCFFAYKNLGAIHDVTNQRIAAVTAIRQLAPDASDPARALLEPTLLTPDFGGLKRFHILSDILTVAALWSMELRRRAMARREELLVAGGKS